MDPNDSQESNNSLASQDSLDLQQLVETGESTNKKLKLDEMASDRTASNFKATDNDDVPDPDSDGNGHNENAPTDSTNWLHTFNCTKFLENETLKPIDKGNPDLRRIKLYIDNSKNVKTPKIQLLNIYEVNRPEEISNSHNTFTKILWHGTKTYHLAKILDQGLQMPVDPDDRLFGYGVYFGDRIANSIQYVNPYHEETPKYLFLAEVQIGHAAECPQSNDFVKDLRQAPLQWPTYEGELAATDSVMGVGLFQPKEDLNEKDENNNWWPLGETKRGIKTGIVYNEWCVYDPRRIKLRYLIECRVKV